MTYLRPLLVVPRKDGTSNEVVRCQLIEEIYSRRNKKKILLVDETC